MKQILNAPLIATMFQESYKNTVTKGQTDLQFRFWNEENGQVDTRYNTSPLVWTFVKNSIHVVQNSWKKISRR